MGPTGDALGGRTWVRWSRVGNVFTRWWRSTRIDGHLFNLIELERIVETGPFRRLHRQIALRNPQQIIGSTVANENLIVENTLDGPDCRPVMLDFCAGV